VVEEIKKNKIDEMCLIGDRSFKTLADLLEVENLMIIGQLVTLAAMLRKETRGAHNREDWPEMDESWSQNIFLQLENNQTTVKIQPILQTE